jgi:hypothetical protein
MVASLNKSLLYPIYFTGIDPNVHVWVFQKAIQTNGDKHDVGIVNLFCFTLKDVISEWGENFM